MKNSVNYLKKHAKTSMYVLLSFSIVFIIASLISYYFIANFENLGINCRRIRVTTNDNSKLSYKLILIFFVPLIEELLYRLGLKFSKTNTAFLVLGLIYTLYLFVMPKINYNEPITLFYFIFSTVLLFVAIRYLVSKKKEQIELIYSKNYNLIFVISVISFAYSHFTLYDNYNDLKNIILSPVILINYILAGILYGILRKKYGIFYGVICHMLWNAVVIFLI